MELQRLRRWYAFHLGAGRRMREQGAEIASCPHCGRDTPIYRSQYDADGDPVSFSVCLWCDNDYSRLLPPVAVDGSGDRR